MFMLGRIEQDNIYTCNLRPDISVFVVVYVVVVVCWNF